MSDNTKDLNPKPGPKFDPRLSLPMDCFGTFDFYNNIWKAVLRPPARLSDVVEPLFWSHVQKKMRKGDIVIVQPSDYSFTRFYMVQAVEPDVIIDRIDLNPEGTELLTPDDLLVKWNVGARGYDIVDKDRGTVLKNAKDIKTKEQAKEWIETYVHNKEEAA